MLHQQSQPRRRAHGVQHLYAAEGTVYCSDLSPCASSLAELLCSQGRLEEADAVLLDAVAVPSSRNDALGRVYVFVGLVDVYVEMGPSKARDALEWAHRAHRELGRFQQLEDAVGRPIYHHMLMSIAEAFFLAGNHKATMDCLDVVCEVGFAGGGLELHPHLYHLLCVANQADLYLLS